MDIIVTSAGRAALINAPNTGTAAVTIAKVGYSATAITPTETMTTLPGEFKRLAGVAGEVVADDVIHINVTDDSADAYALRSFALYLGDGTLFALYGQSEPILEKVAGSGSALSIDAVFADISAAQITFGNTNFTNPPATTERQGVVEMATPAETQAGTDALRAVSPAALKAALLALIIGMDGSGSGIDADLLDGQHASYFTDIAGRLGFTPVNKAGDTMTGLLSLSANPTALMHAAPKQYVDGLVTAAALLAKLLTVDGSGSGLDADLLDGFDSSYFTAIAARLGYTPANKAGDTFTGSVTVLGLVNTESRTYLGSDATGNHWLGATGIASEPGRLGYGFKVTNGVIVSHTFKTGGVDRLVISDTSFLFNGYVGWHSGNDGSGSGLDADLLDGFDSSYFTAIAARLGYTPANKAGDTFTGPLIVSSGAGSFSIKSTTSNRIANFTMQEDGNFVFYMNIGGVQQALYSCNSLTGPFVFNVPVTISGNTAWHAGNDGAGSGLDADTLDGLQSTDFLQQIAFWNAGNGYLRLGNGLMLQWGRYTSSATAGAAVSITFPTSFSAEPYALLLLPVVTTASTISVWSSDGITGSVFPARCSQASIGCRFLAIGLA